jgi:hypothetical protein
MTRLLLLSLVALAAPAHAQNGPSPITREQAMTLPPDQLADIVLRQLGTRVTSVTRPQFNPDTGMQMAGALQHLEFATAPHATDVVGLCAANRIEIGFEPPATPEANRAGTPVRAGTVRAAEVFKVVGEIEPYAEVSEDRAAEEDRRCAAAGPVIPADYNDHERAPFFEYSGAIDRVTALLVVQRAIVDAREGRYSDIRCDLARAECRNPSALLGSLDLANLTFLNSGSGRPDGERVHFPIIATFLISGDAHRREYRTLAINADLALRDGMADTIRGLGRTEIGGYVTVDN